MSILKKPDLADPKLRAKLAKGMGHNYYGEPAWPNDLLYIFPVCILGTISCCIGTPSALTFNMLTSGQRPWGPVRLRQLRQSQRPNVSLDTYNSCVSVRHNINRNRRQGT